jgi:hypothetical protein
MRGLLGAEQGQLHAPVSLKDQAFRQDAHPHDNFQDLRGGCCSPGKTEPRIFHHGRGAGTPAAPLRTSGDPGNVPQFPALAG